MINEMMTAGMLMLGTVDHVIGDQVRIEFVLGKHCDWIDIPLEGSLCVPQEKMEVLFYRDGIVKCFSGVANGSKEKN